MAQVADLKELTVRSQGWQGGINIRDAVEQMQPNELRRAENVVYDAAGGVTKRLGSRGMGPIGSAGDRIISCYTFYLPTTTPGQPQVLAHTSAGNLYYTTDVTANPIVWTLIVGGLSTTTPCAFETQNSNCYFAEGTQFGQWDGTTYTKITAAPGGAYMLRVWKDTMWLATTANPDRLYSSSAGDPTTWPAANYVDILHGDGDIMTCLASDGLFLIVFKRRRTQVVYDPGTLANRTADFEKGCESHFSVVHMEDKLYYLSRTGVCWWQGDSSSRLISYKIDPLFNPLVLNLAAMRNVWAYQLGDRCAWAIPEAGSSQVSVIIEYYPRFGPIYQISGNIGPGPWSMHRIPATCYTTVRQGSTEAIFGGASNANQLLWIFSPDGTDNGAMFQGLVETAPIDFGNPIFTKYLRRAKLLGRGKFQFQLKKNYSVGTFWSLPIDMTALIDQWGGGTWNDGTSWGTESDVQERIVNIDGYGRAFSVVILDSEIATGYTQMPLGSVVHQLTLGEWALYGVAFDATLLGLRGG
jgi:hypothetical protein